jgi:hypothetical protein
MVLKSVLFKTTYTTKKILLSLCFTLLMGFAGKATSASLLTTNPKQCETIKYLVNWNLSCANYSYVNLAYIITGLVLTIHINYTGGMICQGIIGTKSDTAKWWAFQSGHILLR